MYRLSFTSLFRRKLKRLVKNNAELSESAEKTLSLLTANPFSTSLATHKVTSRRGTRLYSSRVTGDLRILWRFHPTEADTVEVVDIGGHSGSKKVYR